MRGILLIILSAMLFGGVDGLSKILAETQPVGQIVWARYAFALPIFLATTSPRLWPALFRTPRPAMQLARAVTPLAISVAMVLAVRYMPLAEATVILFAAPFLVVALSGPFLRERVSAASWIAVAVGFVAVLLVMRPGFSAFSAYAVFPLVAALFYALLQLITRSLGAADESPETTLAWTLVIGAVLTTPFAALQWTSVASSAWLTMVALGLVFGVSQATMIRAFSHASAGLLAPFSYVQIISAALFGALAFGDVPDFWTVAGMAAIIGAGVYVTRSTTP
jgi:drug/metabolite transporter (DMT)-like permease